MRQDERPIAVLHVKAPRCPACGSHELYHYGTVRHGPKGSPARIKYFRCKACQQRIHLNIF